MLCSDPAMSAAMDAEAVNGHVFVAVNATVFRVVNAKAANGHGAV